MGNVLFHLLCSFLHVLCRDAHRQHSAIMESVPRHRSWGILCYCDFMQFGLHGVIQLSTIIVRSVSGTCKPELTESIPEVPAPGDEDILCRIADTC